MTNINKATAKKNNFGEKIIKYLEDNAFMFYSGYCMMNGSYPHFIIDTVTDKHNA